MTIETYIPTARLKPYIQKYVIVESAYERINRILPGTSLAMAFRFKGNINDVTINTDVHLPSAVLTGLRKTPRLIRYEKDSACIIVLFKETAPMAFFKDPMHELFQKSVPLDYFVSPRKISILEEQLAEAPDNWQRIRQVENFLGSRLLPYSFNPKVAAAIEHIYTTEGQLKIKELTRRLFISQDALEKHFRKAIGMSPKQFANLVRMKTVVDNIKRHPSFTGMAYETGFFDQSHFNKEFKLFTGLTPTEFRTSSFW